MIGRILAALGVGLWCSGLSAAQGADTICVNACTDRHWSRVHSQTVSLDIDWGWDWIGEGAETATITVKGLRGGDVREFTLVRPATSAAFALGPVTPQTEDAYEATVTFRNAAGVETGRRTAQFEALAGSFGAVPLLTGTDSREWKRSGSHVALVGYAREWFGDAGPLSLTVSSGAGVRQFALPADSGVVAVRDWGPAAMRLDGGGGGMLAEAFVNFAQGLLLMIR